MEILLGPESLFINTLSTRYIVRMAIFDSMEIDSMEMALMNENEEFLQSILKIKEKCDLVMQPTQQLFDILGVLLKKSTRVFMKLVTKYLIPLIGNEKQRLTFIEKIDEFDKEFMEERCNYNYDND